jgi:steroid 5-alpha reductase family enzyme
LFSTGQPGYTWIIILFTAVLLCFLVSELTFNYSQTDKLWSIMPAIYGGIAMAAMPTPRLILMWVLVVIWGVRLSFNFGRKGGYSLVPWRGEEDYRWKILRQNPLLKGRFRFGIFNLLFISFYQHLLIMLFSTPFLVAASCPDSDLTWTDLSAAILMLLFIATETVADNQQFKFHRLKHGKINKAGLYESSLKNGFLSEGLWKLVRHPNFVSEQAIWLSFYLFGVAASGKWLNWTIAGPLLLILLFQGSTRFTERISAGKYPGYADYQRKVPALFPGFTPKN